MIRIILILISFIVCSSAFALQEYNLKSGTTVELHLDTNENFLGMDVYQGDIYLYCLSPEEEYKESSDETVITLPHKGSIIVKVFKEWLKNKDLNELDPNVKITCTN